MLLNGQILPAENNRIETEKNILKSAKKKRKNKRLNTYDVDYLPDEAGEEEAPYRESENFFIDSKQNQVMKL